MSKYKLAGVEYLEYYLSSDYPSLTEVSKKFDKYQSGIVKGIKIVLKKYGNIEFEKKQRLESISRNELIRILELAKKGESYKVDQNLDKIRRICPNDLARLIYDLRNKDKVEIEDWLLSDSDPGFWKNYSNHWER